MKRLTHRQRRRKSMRKAVLAILCMMRVVNTTLMLYMLIMDLMRVRRKHRIRVNPNVYQTQVDNLNRLVRGDGTDCHGQLRVNRHTFMRLYHDTHSITVDSEDVWEEYVKFHPKASGMNGRAFPMYPSWQMLFGKDRATGEMAEDPAEIRNDASDDATHQPRYEESFVGTNDCYIPRYANGSFVFGGDDFVDLSASGFQQATPPTPTSNVNTNANANASIANPPLKKAKKMTKAEAKHASLHETVGSYMSDTKEVMEKLVNAVGFEQRLSDRRQGVFAQLEKHDLTTEDMLPAHTMILTTEEKVDEFYSVSTRYRQQWVGMCWMGS